MLIGICGSICAGKRSIQDYLVQEHGFQAVYLKPQCNGTSPVNGDSTTASNTKEFSDFPSLLDLVTRRSRERWVTTTIPDEHILDVLMHRPFFLLVTVDAPLITRWHRYSFR